MPPILILILAGGAVALAVALLGKRGDKDLPGGRLPPSLPPPKDKRPSVVGGYDPATAATLAPVVAADVAEKGSKYDRELMRAFQGAAALKVDGFYGGGTRGALIFFLQAAGSPMDAPQPLFNPKITHQYVPPGPVAPPSTAGGGGPARSISDEPLTGGGPPSGPQVLPPPRATYVVQRGDTLSQIANRYGVSWRVLQAYNSIQDANLIQPGQAIRIPPADWMPEAR